MEHFVIDTYNSNLIISYKRYIAIENLLYRFSKFTLERVVSVLTVSSGITEIPSSLRRPYKVKFRRYGDVSVPSMNTEISDFTLY
jgi:hypothetical protein